MQNISSKISLFLLRLAMGWFMFYAGITKVMNSNWTSAGYLGAAKTFPELYKWFASPGVIKITDLLNEWGLTLLGVSLILGIFVRFSSLLGSVLMLLYYFPLLEFPMVGPHAYIVDEHIIYALILLLLASIRAGRVFGVDNFMKSSWLG